eukprot:1707823-Rhodomonas_salina.6
MPGTQIAYGCQLTYLPRSASVLSLSRAMCIRAAYSRAMRCPVLTSRMVFLGKEHQISGERRAKRGSVLSYLPMPSLRMSGTDIAFAHALPLLVSGTGIRMNVRCLADTQKALRQALEGREGWKSVQVVSCTGLVHSAIAMLCDVRYWPSVWGYCYAMR